MSDPFIPGFEPDTPITAPIQSEEDRAQMGRLAVEYDKVDRELKALKDRHKALREKIVGMHAEEIGEQVGQYPTPDGGYVSVTVSIPEKRAFDEEVLEAMFAERALPDFIKRKLSVDLRALRKADENQRKAVVPALTIEPGNAKIKVEPC